MTHTNSPPTLTDRSPFLRAFTGEVGAWTTAVVTGGYAGAVAHEVARVHGLLLFAVLAAGCLLGGSAVFGGPRWARVLVAGLWAAALLTALARHGVAYTAVAAGGYWGGVALLVAGVVALVHARRAVQREREVPQ